MIVGLADDNIPNSTAFGALDAFDRYLWRRVLLSDRGDCEFLQRIVSVRRTRLRGQFGPSAKDFVEWGGRLTMAGKVSNVDGHDSLLCSALGNFPRRRG
jgi:hypothetical protein